MFHTTTTPIVLLGLVLPHHSACAQNVAEVEGIEHFSHGEDAKVLLLRNGFLVVDEGLRQIFQPYIDGQWPVIVTEDVIWQVYHASLERGAIALEGLQTERLLAFSQRLLEVAIKGGADPAKGGPWADVAMFAAIALLLQEPKTIGPFTVRAPVYRPALELATRLRKGRDEERLPFLSTPIDCRRLRPTGMYAGDPDLEGYFRARAYYSLAHFSVNVPEEALRSVILSKIVHDNAILHGLHERLSAPYSELLGPAEDAGVEEVMEAVKTTLGDSSDIEDLSAGIDKVCQVLRRSTGPQISDLPLDWHEYLSYREVARGFRLFPPRLLPAQVLFHRTTHPRITGRGMPSGLDLLVVEPFRCEEGLTALAAIDREYYELIASQGPLPIPNSYYGRALLAFCTLQEEMPRGSLPVFASAAWRTKQLVLQLAAWAELQHTWALHTKLSVVDLGGERPPTLGLVAPYPKFFRDVATLAQQAAELFEKFSCLEGGDLKAASLRLLNVLPRLRSGGLEKCAIEGERGSSNCEATILERIKGRQRLLGLEDRAPLNDLETIEAAARQCVQGGTLTARQRRLVALGIDGKGEIADKLREVGKVANDLSGLAEKTRHSVPYSQDERALIRTLGAEFAKLMGYEGTSRERPRDDAPRIANAFQRRDTDTVLQIGVGRPEVIYVIVPRTALQTAEERRTPSGGKSFVLLRGGVLSYRECVVKGEVMFDDETWREAVRQGTAPDPPEFTKAFRAHSKPGH